MKYVIGAIMRPKPEVPTYQGDFDVNELLECINDMDKFFDYDEIDDGRQAKFESQD